MAEWLQVGVLQVLVPQVRVLQVGVQQVLLQLEVCSVLGPEEV